MRALIPAVAFALLTVASPLAAQAHAGGTPHQASRGWITLDSLVAAVGITAGQRGDVAPHQVALDSLMQAANVKRAALMNRGDTLSEAEIDSLRIEFEHIQQALDTHYDALAALLTAEQRGRLAHIRRPRVMPGSDH